MKKKHFLAMVFAAAILGTSHEANAQGMAINTTGAVASSSAILDASSTIQGMAMPNMTAAQRAAISLPATGLLVYQTDGTAGFYYNNGTPASPSWVSLNTSATTAGGDLANTYPSPTIAATASAGNDIIAALNSASTVTKFNTSRWASGTANSTTYLRGDQTWQPLPGGGSGTVTSFSSGDLSPLFTTGVTSSTSTPAQSFTLATAPAQTALCNSTGSLAAPSFGAVTPADLQNTGGTASSTTYYRGDGQWALSLIGAVNITSRFVSATPVTLLSTDQLVIYTGSSNFVANLPSASSFGAGKILYISNCGTAASFNVVCNGSDQIYFGSNPVGSSGTDFEFNVSAVSDGSSRWYVFSYE